MQHIKQPLICLSKQSAYLSCEISVDPTSLTLLRNVICAALLPMSTSCHVTFWRVNQQRASTDYWYKFDFPRAASQVSHRWLNFNNWRWHVRKKTYDAVGQAQLGKNLTCSFSKSPSDSHSADLLQTEGGIYGRENNRDDILVLYELYSESDRMHSLNEQLTLVELKAEISGRPQTGVVDRFFVQVILGVHIPPELYK